MRKLLIILPLMVLLCLLQGCRKHVYHTYYGDIDIDTMEVMSYDFDDSPCYVVKVIDSLTVEKTGGYAGHGSIFIYYNPHKNIYNEQFPANDEHGNAVIEFNPHKDSAL